MWIEVLLFPDGIIGLASIFAKSSICRELLPFLDIPLGELNGLAEIFFKSSPLIEELPFLDITLGDALGLAGIIGTLSMLHPVFMS